MAADIGSCAGSGVCIDFDGRPGCVRGGGLAKHSIRQRVSIARGRFAMFVFALEAATCAFGAKRARNRKALTEGPS